MKRIWILLTALICLLAVCPAWAQNVYSSDIVTPRTGVAVCAPKKEKETVPMYREADEKSGVWMNYYSGTRIEVLNVMENGMAEVRTGQGKVALTGYMRAEDLRYGANALRAVPWVEGVVEMKKDAPVYAACDTGSEELRLIPKDEVVNVIGISDKWLQIERAEYDGDILRKGYVNDLSEENEYAGGLIRRSHVRVKEAERVERWIYLPTADELTHEQAYEKALDLLTTTDEGRAYLKTRMSEEHRTREALEKLNADIRLSIFGDGNYDGICWIVSIENIQNVDENVIVLMMPQGEWLEFTHGNG